MERYTDNLKITDFIMAWKYDHKIVDDLVEYYEEQTFMEGWKYWKRC